MTLEQWTWLATQQREITNNEGFRFKFTNEWDDDSLPIVIVEKRDPRGVFRYSHPFGFNDNIPEPVKEELHDLWEITREIASKYKTVIEQDKIGTL